MNAICFRLAAFSAVVSVVCAHASLAAASEGRTISVEAVLAEGAEGFDAPLRRATDDDLFRPIDPIADDLVIGSCLGRPDRSIDVWHARDANPWATFAMAAGVSSMLANSTYDQQVRDRLQSELAGDTEDLRWFKVCGEGAQVTAVAAAIYGGNLLLGVWPTYGESHLCRRMRRWSGTTAAALVAGGVANGTLQLITGGSRPGEQPDRRSRWQPFEDDNGSSGHTFTGAVPFLVAAKMTDDPWLKTSLFVASGLTGYTRMYDDAHYLSQVVLGWCVAYLSVELLDGTCGDPSVDGHRDDYRLVPLTTAGLWGVALEHRW